MLTPSFTRSPQHALITCLALALTPAAWAGTASFNTPGTSTWTVPANVSQVTIECRGGGGAGGAAKDTSANALSGGGAGGSYAKKANLPVVAGTTYQVIVGAGGVGLTTLTTWQNGTVDPVQQGGSSSFTTSDSSTTYCLAVGGAGGKNAVNATPTASGGLGTTTGCIGDVFYAGGNGADAGSNGGGGGGGAGDANPGGNAVANAAGAGGSAGGGAGSNGRGHGGPNQPSQAGTAPGGGTGGVKSDTGGNINTSGAGGAGAVKLTYAFDVATDHYAVAATSPQTAGAAFNVTITAQDAANATVTGDINTITMTSSSGLMEFDWDSNGTYGDNSGTLVSGVKTIKARNKKAETATITAASLTKTTTTPPSVTTTVDVFSKLQILAPGETAAPGTTSGKTGTASTQTYALAFNVTVNAVDAYWNLVNSVTHTVAITSSDPAATLPANAALVAGTGTFAVTPNTIGSFTVTATDVTDNTKTANTSSVWAGGVNVYPAVPGLPASDKYTVRVCAAADPSVWANVFTFQTSVPAGPDGNFNYYSMFYGWSHSYVNFEMTVPVTVEISKVGGTITTAAVHPARKVKNVYVSGGKAYLTMDNPCSVAVDIDGQMDTRHTGSGAPSPIHTISIHGNPVLANKPATNDPNVLLVTPGTLPPATGTWTTLYFLPGVHDLGLDFQMYSGKQYYIPGDAIVYGTFNCQTSGGGGGSNIRFFGHGTVSGAHFWHWQMIDPTGNTSYKQVPFNIGVAYNCRLEGITIADPANQSVGMGSWASDANVTNVVSWVKAFTWRPNGDGGGAGANNDVNHVFYRTQDDGLYPWGRRISENVLWNDANGSAIRLSALPNSTFLVDNIDVIYARHYWWSSSSALMAPYGDGGNRGNGVIFSNLNFTDLFPDSPTINFQQSSSGDFAGARFENLTIADTQKNILGTGTNGSIHDLTFNNLVIGGVLVTPSNWLDYFTTSGNVSNIFFTASGGTPPDALPRTGWVATASASGGGSAANAIDGDSNTRWSPGADQTNGQWFQVDMGSVQTFNRIVMDANSSTGDYPRGYEVKVSDDGTNWSSAVATGAGSNAVITISFVTQTARYIRVTQTGSAPGIRWSIHELYAYPPASIILPRTGWVASASASGGGSAANAIDGSGSTRWSPGAYQANGQWFQVDLGSVGTFSQIVLDAGGSPSDYPRGYRVHVSNDGLNWGSAVATDSGSSAVTTINFAPQTARYVRVTQTGSSSSYYWSIYEFNVYFTTPATHTLTKSSPNGTVTMDPAWPTYPAGTVVTVTAVPNAGYVLNNWSGDLSGSANPTTLTMTADQSVTANFAASSATCTLTETSPNGTVTFNPPGPTYPINTVVTVTAVPSAGYVFNNWSGDLAGSANPTTLTMNADKSITANMAYPVLSRAGWVATASASGGGSAANAIDGNGGTRWATGVNQANGQWFQVDMGSAQTFGQIVLDAGSSTSDYPRGYKIYVSNDGSNWGSPVATGTGSSAVTTINFALQTKRYIRVTQTGSSSVNWWGIAEFNVYGPAYALTETSPNGTVTFNPPGPTYLAGTVVTVTAVPDSNYAFTGWGSDLSGTTNPTTVTMAGNTSVTANFAPTTYTLTTSATNGSILSNPPGGIYPPGAPVMLTPTPAPGYKFSSWSGDLSGNENPATLTMSGNKSVTANFGPPTQVTIDTTGGITVLNYDAPSNTYIGNGTLQVSNNGSGSVSLGTGGGTIPTVFSLTGGLITIDSGVTFVNGGWSKGIWTNNKADMRVNGTLDMSNGNPVIVNSLNGAGAIILTDVSSSRATELHVGVLGGSGTFSGTIQEPHSADSFVRIVKQGAGTQTFDNLANQKAGEIVLNAGVVNLSTATDVTFGANIAGAGGLTKTGAGVLTLSGSLTQTGPITISEGTLRIGTNLSTTANVVIATGAVLNLNFVAPLTVSSVSVGGSGPLPPGIYGSSHGTYGSYFAGTGTLLIPGSGYDVWAGTNSVSDGSPEGDPDGDGIKNILEYVLGGDPRKSSTAFLPKGTIDGTDLVLTYKRSDDSETDTTQAGQWSTDLQTWSGVDVTTELVSENGSAPDDMKIRIPLSKAIGGKLHGRLHVSKP